MHDHHAPQDGSGERTLPDGSVRADDECDCGVLLCPDTNLPVTYRDSTLDALLPPDHGLPSYWHQDGSVCFLHPASVLPEELPKEYRP